MSLHPREKCKISWDVRAWQPYCWPIRPPRLSTSGTVANTLRNVIDRHQLTDGSASHGKSTYCSSALLTLSLLRGNVSRLRIVSNTPFRKMSRHNNMCLQNVTNVYKKMEQSSKSIPYLFCFTFISWSHTSG